MGANFKIYTVYDHPTDYPDEYVVRTWNTGDETHPVPDTELFLRDKNLEKIRLELASMGLTCLEKDGDDDEKIVESWW
jgi:hypothetical protein